MHALAHNYAAALIALEREGFDADAAMRGLMRTLKQRGHERLLPAIGRALTAHAARNAAGRSARIIVARSSDAKTFARDIAEAADSLAVSPASLAVETDEAIIGGFVIATPEKRYDASYRRSLIDIYRAATA